MARPVSGASVETMTDKPELNWAQLNELTNEVRGASGPGTKGWRAEGSHTRRFNEAFIEEFRRHGGKMPGELGEVDLLLLTAKGAKSGEPRTVPVGFHRIDGRLCVIASMGGADRNPPWFYNVVANPEVTVELGTEVFRALAVITEGEDHDRLYGQVVARMPVFADYQERTGRVIPVIELQRLPESETS
jgi:deazaflavin-dependent oxidoreductase (nitroreductase family)